MTVSVPIQTQSQEMCDFWSNMVKRCISLNCNKCKLLISRGNARQQTSGEGEILNVKAKTKKTF